MNKKEEIKNRIDLINRGEVPEGYKNEHGYTIPKDWQELPLIDMCTKRQEKAGCKKLETLSISAGIGFVNQAEKFGRELSGEQYKNYTVIRAGDFSYNKGNSKKYPQGCIYLLKDRKIAAVPNVFNTFRLEDSYNAKYYMHLFSSGYLNKQLFKWINFGVRNDGLLNLYDEDFYKSILPIPPKQEQEKIAKILNCCDKVIELKQKLLVEKLNEKKYLMDKSFSKKYENNYQLKELGTTFIGLSNKNKNDFGYGKPYIPYINIFNNTFVEANRLEYVNILPNENQTTVKYGDIFFTTSSECPEEVGMASVWLYDFDEVYLNSFCFGYRLNDFKILIPEYAGYYFRSPYFRVILNRLAQGVTRFNLSKNNLMEEKISLPSLEKQKHIAKIFLKIDKQIKLLEQELEQYKQLKKALSQLLLTGIVRTVEADCEN